MSWRTFTAACKKLTGRFLKQAPQPAATRSRKNHGSRTRKAYLGKPSYVQLIARASLTPRALLREKSTPYAELGLSDAALTDDQIVDAMMGHPILINRPLVVTPLGVKLCRPSELVLDILPSQLHEFTKEHGELNGVKRES